MAEFKVPKPVKGHKFLYTDLIPGEYIRLKKFSQLGDPGLRQLYRKLNLDLYDEEGVITYVDKTGVSILFQSRELGEAPVIDAFFPAGSRYVLSNFFMRVFKGDKRCAWAQHNKKVFPNQFLRKDK